MLPLGKPTFALPATFESKRWLGGTVRIDVDERGIAIDRGGRQSRLRWIDVVRIAPASGHSGALTDGAGTTVALPNGLPNPRLFLDIVQERLTDAHAFRLRRLGPLRSGITFYQRRRLALTFLALLGGAVVIAAWWHFTLYLELLFAFVSALIYFAALPMVAIVAPAGIELQSRMRSIFVAAASMHSVELRLIENRGAVITMRLNNFDVVELRDFGAGTLTLFDRLQQLQNTAGVPAAPALIRREWAPRRAAAYAAAALAATFMLLWLPVLSGRALSEGVRVLPLPVIEALLDGGSAVDRPDWSGRTATYNAAKFGRIDVLELLLARGADPARRSSNAPGHTALHVAAEYNQQAAVRRLLAAGASPNVLNNWDQTPLMQLASLGHRTADEPAIAQLLIDAGTDLNRRDNRGFTILHKIDEPALEWLIGVVARHGASLDARNDGDETPFDRAMLDRRPWLARALAAAGANVNARRVNDDDSWLWELTNREDLERVTLLLECGARTDIAGSGGFLPLQVAVRRNNLAVTRALVDGGANVDASTPDVGPALRIAISEKNKAIIQLLLERGANADAFHHDLSALQVAANGGDAELVEWLLRHGANPNITSSRAAPPLLIATAEGHLEIMKLLLSHGASPDAEYQGWTARELAVRRNNRLAHELLTAAGAR